MEIMNLAGTTRPASLREIMDPSDNQIPEVELSSEALTAAAEAATGLTDWGDPLFREPLERYLLALEESAGLHRQGRYMFFVAAQRLLCNRLMIQRDLTEHPEILETPLPRPLFVLGLPRTGTTLLHNLLACDPAARYIRLCEGWFPSPPPTPETWAEDPRIGAAEEMAGKYRALAPTLFTAHALEPLGAEECLWLFEHSFADMIHELRAHVPSYSAWLKDHEADPAFYRDFRRMVQVLGYRWPGKHWVFKAPRHLMGLAGLLEVFPDARIVWTHRDPLEVVPSLCSLCKIDQEISTDQPDPVAIGDHWSTRLRDALDSAMKIRDADPQSDRYVDIDYRQLVADPIAVVREIYDRHGYPFSREFEIGMQEWLEANRQHKHGKHVYSLEEYGLDETQLRQAFADYQKRFLDPN
ncbi:MAG: sulfotransferase family protein [Verrucomicrobiales bacterium]